MTELKLIKTNFISYDTIGIGHRTNSCRNQIYNSNIFHGWMDKNLLLAGSKTWKRHSFFYYPSIPVLDTSRTHMMQEVTKFSKAKKELRWLCSCNI